MSTCLLSSSEFLSAVWSRNKRCLKSTLEINSTDYPSSCPKLELASLLQLLSSLLALLLTTSIMATLREIILQGFPSYSGSLEALLGRLLDLLWWEKEESAIRKYLLELFLEELLWEQLHHSSITSGSLLWSEVSPDFCAEFIWEFFMWKSTRIMSRMYLVCSAPSALVPWLAPSLLFHQPLLFTITEDKNSLSPTLIFLTPWLAINWFMSEFQQALDWLEAYLLQLQAFVTRMHLLWLQTQEFS